MMAELGVYYFDESTGFPAIVIKILEGDSLLIKVWSDEGDQTRIASRSDSPGSDVFVSNG